MLTRPAHLPGIRFEVQAPAPQFILPRMDIGAFVGFAASGPLHLPVAVEDAAHFREIFGDDLPLAWDSRRGAFEMAYLGPAVRDFFRNGGRRCHVVRVAGPQAETNRFPIPGLLRAGKDKRLGPAYAQARSPGSWSDNLNAGTEILLQPLQLVRLELPASQAVLRLPRADQLQPGDLLRFSCAIGEEHYQLMLVPDWIETLDSSPRSTRVRLQWKDEHWSNLAVIPDPNEKLAVDAGQMVRVHWATARWFRLPGLPSDTQPGRASVNESSVERSWVTTWVPESTSWTPGKPVQLALDLPPTQAPEPGKLVEAEFGGEQLWLTVLAAHAMRSNVPGAGTKDHVVITGSGLWESSSPVGNPSEYYVERLRLMLIAKQAGAPAASRMSIGNLGFARSHSSFWSALPVDDDLYGPYPPGVNNPYAELWKAAQQPRFPLAGLAIDKPSFTVEPDYPLPLPSDSGLFSRPLPTGLTPLERSGLSTFSLDLFLDPLLKDSGVDTLQAQADFLSYQSPIRHDPRGIYTALRLEEVTLIAVPDALHVGWERDLSRPEPLKALELPPADMNCTPPLHENQAGNFGDRYYLGRPLLTIDPPTDPTIGGASFRVNWSAAAGLVAAYRLEESLSADFTNAITVYYGPQNFFDLSERSTGAYYYRVRAEGTMQSNSAAPTLVGPWSEGVGIRLGAVRPWRTRETDTYQEDALVRFHSALLTLCAARGDLFAVLSLPAFYHEDEALHYTGRLKGLLDSRTLSFGALYHPWLYAEQEQRDDPYFMTPPDGAVCGAIARRTQARGAWLAPANDPLTGILALQPALAAGRFLDLQEGGLNILRQEPRGLMSLCEQTLSDAGEIRPMHVRRLLMLLRRLVQREGANFVFEPNSLAFRRQVQRGLEQVLAGLFQRGAFQGAVPEEGYQVDVSDRINPPASLEQGRLIVEIRVAPSQPLTFLTIRLVMSGLSGLRIQEGA